MMLKSKKIFAVLAAVAASLSLAACGGSNASDTATANSDKHANDNASCTNKVVHADAQKVTVWAWYPGFEKIVDHFNNSHSDVQVCWNNGGQGGAEYTRFQNTIKAGKGAPDIIQLEYEAMPQFIAGQQKYLVDLGKYGMNSYKADYTDGAWNSVTFGSSSSVYAVPVDAGPFVMYVNQEVFDKYQVKVPTTWAEFEQAGKDLQAKGYTGKLTNWQTDGTAVNIALFAQKGAQVYKYSASDPTKVGIDFDQQGVKDVLSYWQKLSKEGLIDTADQSSTDTMKKFGAGDYATYVQASWFMGYYVKGAYKTAADSPFKIYEAPKWDDSTPDVNQGGSAFAVTYQAKDTKAAAEVARELYGDDYAQKSGVSDGGLFPTWKKLLSSTEFINQTYPYLGDQKANEVIAPVAKGWAGDQFLPFQTYAYDAQQKSFASIVKSGTSVDSGVSKLTSTLQDYAKQQGFTVESVK
ncbi:sugar ABC transporter substrate-binding protein [Bifidobacterium psychraerophilum]|jgi:multiple sugar transport system substrate-binding protein|uniref:Sugar ABC transporter, substrate-binding protein n=1 Tax=Bifidobacterium psychraerophilum TaxID=218140 RepID=A0A087CLQ9_9BIFI|nr:extracellular solute-binding protein [Bifidobacterium psychraerophilum]KFI84209.1 sugar ABC transporter, substrate-binding protein [Bifidobacterium psychraerophilum]PKA94065.1 multiple sugar transport system substrate-binding protein [Bifidobacterium psychraerophilum DSM 22366]